MTFDDLTNAADARARAANTRVELIQRAINHGANSGHQSAALDFVATPEEKARLIALGYSLSLNASGATNIYWF
jgi:hypothetical protein